jgi:hypothetical protein
MKCPRRPHCHAHTHPRVLSVNTPCVADSFCSFILFYSIHSLINVHFIQLLTAPSLLPPRLRVACQAGAPLLSQRHAS